MKRNVIIVAGGKGSRMNNAIPKQFIPINGKPMVMHTIEAFASCCNYINIILVLPADSAGYWQSLCLEHDFQVPCKLVHGGETRFQSVKNGLDSLTDPGGLVAVHDGSRPLVCAATIERTFSAAMESGAAIPVTTPVESIREIDGNVSVSRDRSMFRMVQTPQVFDLQLLKKAYNQPYSTLFTDDASVIEAYGHIVSLVEGNPSNIKVTTPLDLSIASLILDDKKLRG